MRLALSAATGAFLVSLAGVLAFGLDHPQAASEPDSTCTVAPPTVVQLAECIYLELALGSVGERYATNCKRNSKRDYLCWVYRYTNVVDCRRVRSLAAERAARLVEAGRRPLSACPDAELRPDADEAMTPLVPSAASSSAA